MPLYSLKITIAANDTAQAVSAADLATASIAARKSKANQIIVYSETGNSAAVPARIGGAQAHRTNGIGLLLEPGGREKFESGGAIGMNPFDVTTTFVSATIGDVFNYTWFTD